jgi:hypothetical protein
MWVIDRVQLDYTESLLYTNIAKSKGYMTEHRTASNNYCKNPNWIVIVFVNAARFTWRARYNRPGSIEIGCVFAKLLNWKGDI